MQFVKLSIVILSSLFLVAACGRSGASERYVIAESKSYEATLFRQNCAICHGSEGEGKTLDTGIKVPSLREGDFKAVTEHQIHNQIANGGNGMLAFRRQLTDREIQLLVTLVKRDLRGQ
ncbi:MAG: cytochrome c [Pyrinomonadaceae bacterium]|nr:cytochrome c [Pyrinomonadaceae bacterium]